MAKQMPTTENSNSTAPYIFGELAADVFALLIKPPNPPSRHPETTFPKSFVAVIPAAAAAPGLGGPVEHAGPGAAPAGERLSLGRVARGLERLLRQRLDLVDERGAGQRRLGRAGAGGPGLRRPGLRRLRRRNSAATLLERYSNATRTLPERYSNAI